MLVPLMERLRVGRRTRYDKCSIVYRAAVVLSGVVAWLNYLTRHALGERRWWKRQT